ncbi:hypothetical protein BDA99DRAFT_514947 [Phascolomyces articulosus]|uniref:Uncharacterized protein n=1 Tax=Phascolomyces articulosus TaxID=60185 RepID=A0AAD5PCE3_9FUNG|nr:hypothetical protein BDA99DRAFT_514947 [Phascolomyces articulosus]
MNLILRFFILLSITQLLLVHAVSTTRGNTNSNKYSQHSLFRAVTKNYQYDPIFAAKEYETYVNTSGMDMTPPVLLHQFGLASPRLGHQLKRSSSSSVGTISMDKSTATTTTSNELLVSGPALAFIVVLTLGAFMF